MTNQEQRALALVNEAELEASCEPTSLNWAKDMYSVTFPAVVRAIEKIDAVQAEFDKFQQEVSDFCDEWRDVVEVLGARPEAVAEFDRYIIKPPVDPLVEALGIAGLADPNWIDAPQAAADIRAALAKHGLEITPKKGLNND